ncbi:hypothetical protein OG765_25220 [Streptomyces sp. NBC_00555]|uniref:hypothetical protein n=1 Tax=Streptomyces sp. NBC_00555 TaxID=2903662 RepID=UPI00224CA410|nr:hypothetical protein [Streptomyces sp. NBC_00555]MCX5014261.1 hypothetical protein [Streptomyces sp. NBC_00555]
MNGRDDGQGGHGGHGGQGGQDGFESDLRVQMAQGATAVRPAPAPYQAIVRQGRVEQRRRRLAVAGAALVVLAVVPVTAITLTGDRGAGPSDRVTVAGGGPTPSAAPQSPQPPAGPAAPATPGQLADGITLPEAAAGLEQCLEYDRQRPGGAGFQRGDLGKAAEYRILLAHRSTGNDNTPGDGRYIVAVKENPTPTRIICSIKNGQTSGLNTSVGADDNPERGPVVPDINGGKLYLQRLSSEGPWKLPYRWGSIGTVVDPRVARVTVSYGGATAEAALDHGWFAATGILERAVTQAPRIKGYDAQGTQVYDSDQDKSYDKPIP